MDARNEPSLQIVRGGVLPASEGQSAPQPTAPRESTLPDNLTLGDLALLEGIGQSPLLPPREPFGARIAALLGRHGALLFLLCFAACWAIITVPTPLGHKYHVGERPGQNILAPYALTLLDHDETDRRRHEAAALVPPQYDPNADAQAVALSKLHRATQRYRSQARFAALRWSLLERAAQSGVRTVYFNAQVRSDVADDLREAARRAQGSVARAALQLGLLPQESRVAFELARQAARVPNLVVNEHETDAARSAAQRRVPAVYERIEADMPVARANEEITPETLTRLEAIESVPSRFETRVALANALLCLIVLSACAASLRTFNPQLMTRPAALWLAAVVPVAFLLGFRALLPLPHADLMMAPIAATAAMLLTVLVDVGIGITGGTLVAALCALLARAEAGLFLTAALTSWIGAISVRDITRAATLVRAAAIVALAGAMLSASLGLLRGATSDELFSTGLWGAISGALSVGATTVLALLLERPFGLTTHLRLLELVAPDETVLKRMQTEAPGTYTHSLMVAMLSEAAAKKVGADPLLCRVGGLYHDIGKLRRPHCFIENQHGDNIHDRLSPQLSALVILAHVKDGLQLGRAIKLPDPILGIISQHHGSSLIAYFYDRAVKAADESRAPDPAHFRYPGPRPQSKEAALIMLADSVEASARALHDTQPESLRAHIRDMIAARLRENELSECDLTLRDLSTVEEEFTRVLRGALHGRVAYPESREAAERRQGKERQGKERKVRSNTDRPLTNVRQSESPDAVQARAWVKDTVRAFGARLPRTDGRPDDFATPSVAAPSPRPTKPASLEQQRPELDARLHEDFMSAHAIQHTHRPSGAITNTDTANGGDDRDGQRDLDDSRPSRASRADPVPGNGAHANGKNPGTGSTNGKGSAPNGRSASNGRSVPDSRSAAKSDDANAERGSETRREKNAHRSATRPAR